mgnify:CR=1 FL=1
MREAINTSNSNINNIMICFGGQPSIYLPFLSSQSKSHTQEKFPEKPKEKSPSFVKTS